MTTQQYLTALKKLGLTPASKITATALGYSVRNLQRFAAGAPVSARLALLLESLLERKASYADTPDIDHRHAGNRAPGGDR